ncbi:hypothetical protein [Pantoea sp. CCBC3-3-1]|uniref:hypothetical protein n=1 Tax=Pantoea sp. CCBC3-3-1 TaxID=2490851 RepID=UPI001C2C5F8D|nr:hypothetical protein [Pantoea sp. CCBC3-3-1]
MTQVIYGLTREQLMAQFFNKSLVAGAVTTILVKAAAARAERDSRQQQGKPRGGGF